MELMNTMTKYLKNTMDIGSREKVKAIILSGGQGRKMFHFNSMWQKSCLPIGNIPNIIKIVNKLQKFGIDDIVVLTDYLDSQVSYSLKGFSGLEIKKTSPASIKQDIYHIVGDKDLLIYYGDVYVSNEDLEDLLLS